MVNRSRIYAVECSCCSCNYGQFFDFNIFTKPYLFHISDWFTSAIHSCWNSMLKLEEDVCGTG